MRGKVKNVLLAMLCIGAALGCRTASDYPNAPMLLVCPWSAGGGTDRIARHIAALLEPELGVPVNVVNVTGGDGVTGHSRGALARPDGHTLTLFTVEIATLHDTPSRHLCTAWLAVRSLPCLSSPGPLSSRDRTR